VSDAPLSHFDAAGAARVVSIDDKPETLRSAVARGLVRMQPETLARIRAGQLGKGDVLGVARLAAIAATKTTAQLIPLCHPIRVTGVDVEFGEHLDLASIEVRVTVTAIDRTGPEMEAMTAASVAALTIYDMCKGIDREMTIESIALVAKSGGKSGDWTRPTARPESI